MSYTRRYYTFSVLSALDFLKLILARCDLIVPKDIDELDEFVDEDDSFLLISTLLLDVGEDSKEGEVGGGEHG